MRTKPRRRFAVDSKINQKLTSGSVCTSDYSEL